MARRGDSTDTVEETTPPWVEDGFRYLTNEQLGGLHRCPDTGDALASFYGRGWVDAVKPATPAPPAPSADAWVEDGFRYLTNPQTDGTTRVPDDPAALQSFYDRGWVDAERPGPVEALVPVSETGGWVDEEGFRHLTHPDTGGTTRAPNSPDALTPFYERGWVDADANTPPEPAPAEPADGDPKNDTEPPAVTATTEKE